MRAMLAEGSQAPEFTLLRMDGSTISSTEIAQNGPALLVFFKISCPTCQFTFPFLERLSKNSKLQVIGVSQNDAEGTAEFNQAFGISFPILLDSEATGFRASNGFGISHVPSMFVMEPDGKISTAEQGFTKLLLEELGERAGVAVFSPAEKIPLYKPG